MSKKHTPGPWGLSDSTPIPEAYTAVVSTDPECEIAWVMMRDVDDPEQLEANARLIAAAPMLLEACRKLARLGSWTGITPPGFNAAWEAAITAIALTR